MSAAEWGLRRTRLGVWAEMGVGLWVLGGASGVGLGVWNKPWRARRRVLGWASEGRGSESDGSLRVLLV